MKSFRVTTSCIALTVFIFSSPVFANHPVDANIKIERDSLKMVKLNKVRLRHDNDGKYRLSGLVRRHHSISAPLGHFDLTVIDEQGNEVYEDQQYYWPRVINRRYRYPSEFVFAVPDDLANSPVIKLNYHIDKLAKRPKPAH